MVRVTVRYESETADGKVLRFEESMDFDALLLKIVEKLELVGDVSMYELHLGGGRRVVVEDTSEIEQGDDLILMKKKRNHVKKEEDHDNEADDSDSGSVQDVTEESLKKKSKQQEEDVVVLSSDEDDDDNDDDDDEGSIAEGSDAWDEEPPSSTEDDSDGEDSDFEMGTHKKLSEKKKKGQEKKIKTKKPPAESPLQVIIDEKDIPMAPGKQSEQKEAEEATANHGLEEVSLLVNGTGRKKADQKVKDRIIKLLNTGFHDRSNENEAKVAMKLASRLMQKHNLNQALLLKEREEKNKKDQVGDSNNEDEILKGGMVHVRIVNRNTGKPALFARWLNDLMTPVAKNFNVDSYKSARRGRKCTVTFYGIYTNTQLAGYAFKVAVERIAQMSAEHQPEKGHGFRGISTKSSRLSYALGIVAGISEEVNNNIKRAEERRLEKLSKARMAQSKAHAYEESDDEDEGDMDLGGGDDDDDNDDKSGPGFSFASSPPQKDPYNSKVESQSSKSRFGGAKGAFNVNNDDDNDDSLGGEPESCGSSPQKVVSGDDLKRRIEELEKQNEAAIVLVNHREKVAEQVLKENGVKLSKGRKRKAIDFDHRSYHKGIEDSREIDINQRAIRDEVRVKKEKKPKKSPSSGCTNLFSLSSVMLFCCCIIWDFSCRNHLHYGVHAQSNVRGNLNRKKPSQPIVPRASLTVPMHYESGSHHVYIYAGSPKPQRQTLILDTGSRYMAFPCEPCEKCGKHASKFYFNDTQSTTHRDNYHPNCLFAKAPKKGQGNACVFEQTYLEGSSWVAKEVEDMIWLATADEEESIEEYMPHMSIPFTFGCQTKVTGYFVQQVSTVRWVNVVHH